MGTWQDVVVTIVAGIGAVIVFWRTFGAWKDSKPGASGTPGCDHCVVADLARERDRGLDGDR
jgi:hypothetical protein